MSDNMQMKRNDEDETVSGIIYPEDGELVWMPLKPLPLDVLFTAQQQQMCKELIEKFGIPSQMLGEVREYTDAEKQEARERAYHVLVEAAYEVGKKHEH